MGDPLPVSVKLEIPASIKNLRAEYTDGCGHLMQVPLGTRLEEALVEGAYRTFKSVSYEGGGSKDAVPEALVRVDLVNWSFKLQQDNVYDRVPANIQLNAIARVYDLTGKVLRESEVKVVRQERLRLEATQRNCDYIIDPFIQDTSVDFAAKVSMDVRQAFGGATQGAAPAVASAPATLPQPAAGLPTSKPQPPAATATAASSLRFKAMVLDENGNLVLEGGERVRVRVDIVNVGTTAIQQAIVSLSGSQALITHFPSAVLPVPTLQAGETKSIEFVATLPPSVQPQKAELHVTVEEPATHQAAPSQTLAVVMQATGIKTDDVDQIPVSTTEFRQPNTYLISIGIGSYRDQQLLPRKFASLDAEMVSNYFQALGGVPSSNVRLLQDWKALRPDIDEALLDWLPPHMSKDAVVIVYFAGQALVNHTGDVLLVPYEGSPTATSRLYPLKDLEAALARLKAKQTILLFDGMVSRLHSDPKIKNLPPRWDSAGSSMIRIISSDSLSKGLEDDKHRHGLMTYYLLRALRGESDSNRDGSVTLAEVAAYVSQKVSWAAKTQFSSDQRPLITPPLKQTDPSSGLVLSKLAAIRGE
ncbi:MAG: caspase family protein [Nitrospira sp.]|nr:caspase family protein [Nitrospira sp.]